MPDFTSALYLGFDHAHSTLPPWHSLTTGKPAALSEPTEASRTAVRIAAMQGLENGVLGVSTLHLFWDFFGMLDANRFNVFYDRLLYPVGKWGVERAKCRGLKVVPFGHLSPVSLRQKLRMLGTDKRPIVVTDGWCPRCGKAAPIQAYLNLIRPLNGLLVIDDTQAFGVLGNSPSPTMPYGYGGGGILKWQNVKTPHVLTITSLAKAFGVPVAALCGSKEWVRFFTKNSDTRVNSSPVSLAHLSAAKQALYKNRIHGDLLRKKLWRNVSHFRQNMKQNGLPTKGGIFPIQTLGNLNEKQTDGLQQRLARHGFQTVLLAPHGNGRPELLFLLTTGHSLDDLKKAACIAGNLFSNLLKHERCKLYSMK